MAKIKTGADKLIELVSEKKKISVDDAAKILGVGKDLVQEWSEFLEEEGMITLEYTFSKTWISEKKITKDDVIKSSKEVISQKEAFARKIEIAMASLDKETLGFEKVRSEFVNIQSHIKNEIETVKKELSELERYDSLKKNLDKDVAKQREQYSAVLKEAEEKLSLQTKKYESVKKLIDSEKKNVDEYFSKIESLKKIKSDYEKSIESLKISLKNVEEMLSSYKKQFDDSSKNISSYKESLIKLEKELSENQESTLLKKFKDLESGQSLLLKNQQEINSQLKTKSGTFLNYSNVSEKIHKSFEGFFTKTIDTEKLMDEIEKEKQDLRKELEVLQKKILSFDLMKGSESIKSQLKEIELEIKKQEKRRDGIRAKIERLIQMIRGEDKKS